MNHLPTHSCTRTTLPSAAAAAAASSHHAVSVAALAVTLLAAFTAPPQQRQSHITAPRLLAVTAIPPEANPGETVTITPWFAAPNAEPITGQAEWALCVTPKAPSEDNAVAAACASGTGSTPLPTLSPANATQTFIVPLDACARFGPDTPPGAFRPRSPDLSGGYYQPVRVAVHTSTASMVGFGAVRIRCNLAGAPPTIAQTYQRTYQANQNPMLSLHGGADTQEVVIEARWPSTAQEQFVNYDARTQQLTTATESLHLSWFSDVGEFARDATLHATPDAALNSAAYLALSPVTDGPGQVWVVARDSRGGIAVAQLALPAR